MISFFYKHAGLVSVSGSNWSFHLFPKPRAWVWVYGTDWYDGPIYMFGLGPLFHFNIQL